MLYFGHRQNDQLRLEISSLYCELIQFEVYILNIWISIHLIFISPSCSLPSMKRQIRGEWKWNELKCKYFSFKLSTFFRLNIELMSLLFSFLCWHRDCSKSNWSFRIESFSLVVQIPDDHSYQILFRKKIKLHENNKNKITLRTKLIVRSEINKCNLFCSCQAGFVIQMRVFGQCRLKGIGKKNTHAIKLFLLFSAL